MANAYSNITREYLLEKYNYDPETGIVTTKYTRRQVGWNHRNYLAINHKGKKLKLHRLIWLMVYGEWPEIIDHINFDKKDNRLVNLRSVDVATNNAHRNNDIPKSNVPYISYIKVLNKWKAIGLIGKKQIYLGAFINLEDAISRQKEFYLTGK